NMTLGEAPMKQQLPSRLAASILVFSLFLGLSGGIGRCEDQHSTGSSPQIGPSTLDGLILRLSVDVSAFHKGPEVESLKEISTAHPIVFSWWLSSLEKQVGVPVDDLERAAIFGDKDGNWAFLVLGSKPLDLQKVRNALVPQATEQKVNGKTTFVDNQS